MVTPGGSDADRLIAEARAEALRIVTEAKQTVTAALESLEQRRRAADKAAADIIRRAEQEAAELKRRATERADPAQNSQLQPADLNRRREELANALTRLTTEVERITSAAARIQADTDSEQLDPPRYPPPTALEGGVRPPMPPSMWASMVTNGGRSATQPAEPQNPAPALQPDGEQSPATGDDAAAPTSMPAPEVPPSRREPWASRWLSRRSH